MKGRFRRIVINNYNYISISELYKSYSYCSNIFTPQVITVILLYMQRMKFLFTNLQFYDY